MPSEIAWPPSSAKPPPAWRTSTDTLPTPKDGTARSASPSPLKSPTVAVLGAEPTAIGEPASCAKPPAAWRRNTDTSELVPLIVATSGRPSPLKSPALSDSGSFPTVYGEPSGTKAAQALAAPTNSSAAASAAAVILALTARIIPIPARDAIRQSSRKVRDESESEPSRRGGDDGRRQLDGRVRRVPSTRRP